MIKCPYCNYENPEGEKLCIKCGLPLSTSITQEGSTRRLEKPSDMVKHPRWGTARLGEERKLLLHIRGYDRPLVVNLTDQLILGRYDTNTGEMPDIDLDAYGAQEHGVSRQHAVIMVAEDALKVMDLGSANATYMNGQKLMAHQARILRDGDELRLGDLHIRVNFA
ncbi:MAG: FHA domain-containing protein [Chloroflexi bacterium]|nr:FHA domain-containing protein [Chloroflexota bacterium]